MTVVEWLNLAFPFVCVGLVIAATVVIDGVRKKP